jgi:hypothetical protein
MTTEGHSLCGNWQGYTGIELTEYYRDYRNKYGSPLRAKETHEETVLKRASSGYTQRGLPPVHVGILWSPSTASAVFTILEH